MSLTKTIYKNQDYIKFFGYLILTIFLIPYIISISIKSWNIQNGLVGLIYKIILYFDDSGISILVTFISGFYIGSLALMFFDRKKRIQAIVLLIGSFVVTYYIYSGQILSEIQWSEKYIWIGYGIAAGLILGGGADLFKEKKEYKRASKNISILSIGLVLFAILNLLISSRESLTKEDIAVSGAFILLFREFMNYEVKGPKMFILGPAKSGKSLFLAGCYLDAFNKAESPIRPNSALFNLVQEIYNGKWPERTSEISEYSFVYETGNWFPKETVVKSIDWPGPFLSEIVKYMGISIEKLNTIDENLDKKIKDEYYFIAQEILNSDKLVFIIDGEKYQQKKFSELGIDSYIAIINKLIEHNKKVDYYIVVTKCDLFRDEFIEKMGIDAENYENFRNYIQTLFLRNFNIKQLLNNTENDHLYPVYYYTEIINGERVPMFDENKNLFIFGFGDFMDDLIK